MLPRLTLAAFLLVTAHIGAANAQGLTGGLGVNLRLEGIVEPRADAATLGMLSIRVHDRLRGFGVRTALASNEEGMSIFRGVIQYPENLRLIGSSDVLRPFYEAAPGSHVRMLGVFKPDLRWLLVGEIQISNPTASPQPGNET